MDLARARELIKEVSIWIHGYSSALGNDSPFTPEYMEAFAAAENALIHLYHEQQRAAQAPTQAPPSIVLQEHDHGV